MNGRRPRVVLAVGVLLWLVAVGAAIVPLLDEETGPSHLRAAPLPATTCAGPVIGVNATLGFGVDADRGATTVTAIRDDLGAQVVRDSLLWHQVEPTEGDRDWSVPDRVVEELRGAGIEPLLTVTGSPSWANGVSESTPEHYLYVPERGPALEAWLGRYSSFLAAAVRRYRDVVNRWEVWNEPNFAAFWRPRPDPVAYRQVYETLRATILSVDPKAEVAVGGLGRLTLAEDPDVSGLTFLRRLTRTQPPLDAVAIHPYATDDHPPDVHVPGANNFDDIQRVRDQLVADGERASIWVTEWGWSSATVGEQLQAQYVDSSLAMIENSYPFVGVATYFVDRDRPPRFFHGLLDADLQPKPAASVFREHAVRFAARCRSRSG